MASSLSLPPFAHSVVTLSCICSLVSVAREHTLNNLVGQRTEHLLLGHHFSPPHGPALLPISSLTNTYRHLFIGQFLLGRHFLPVPPWPVALEGGGGVGRGPVALPGSSITAASHIVLGTIPRRTGRHHLSSEPSSKNAAPIHYTRVRRTYQRRLPGVPYAVPSPTRASRRRSRSSP